MQTATQTAMPSTPLTNPNFAWVPSANTDVTRTFKKHGWTAPDRSRQRAMKRLLNQIDDLDAQLDSARL